MKYQIDQSGKIEKTNKNTVLCISNGDWDAVLIEARTKRQLQEIFRRNGQIRNFVIFTFCAGLAILIKRNLKAGAIIIDREYYGREATIKEILLEMLEESRTDIPIAFGQIGKHSPAHMMAKEIFRGNKKAGCVISFNELLRQTKKTEVGKRLKNA